MSTRRWSPALVFESPAKSTSDQQAINFTSAPAGEGEYFVDCAHSVLAGVVQESGECTVGRGTTGSSTSWAALNVTSRACFTVVGPSRRGASRAAAGRRASGAGPANRTGPSAGTRCASTYRRYMRTLEGRRTPSSTFRSSQPLRNVATVCLSSCRFTGRHGRRDPGHRLLRVALGAKAALALLAAPAGPLVPARVDAVEPRPVATLAIQARAVGHRPPLLITAPTPTER